MMDEERLASSLKHARNVIVCAGFNSSTEGEGFDRPFALSYGQEYLINKVASLHDNVAVVVNAGGGIDFRNWGQSVQAILMAWYPGQEGGKALAEIITGNRQVANYQSASRKNGKIIRYMVIIMTIAMYLINGCSMPKVFS